MKTPDAGASKASVMVDYSIEISSVEAGKVRSWR